MSKTTVWLACYKGRTEHRGIARLADWLTRKITRGHYSHCELAVKHGEKRYLCYSASLRDRGVRGKIMPLPADKWDMLPPVLAFRMWKLFSVNMMAKNMTGAEH